MTVRISDRDVPPMLSRQFELDPRLPAVLKAELGPGSYQVLVITREDLNTHVRILGKSVQLSNLRAYALIVEIVGERVEVLKAVQVRDDIEPPPGTAVFYQAVEGISRRPR